MKTKSTKKRFLKFIASFLILCLNYTGILAISDTFAYFHDTETSNNNSFEVGTLNFSLSSNNDFSPELKDSQLTSVRTVNLNQDGTLGFKYKVKVESAVGGLCSYLSLKDDLTDTYEALSSFVSDETSFSAKPNLIFTTKSSNYDSSLQGEICNFNLVFEGWQTNLTDNTQGFTDIETINNTIKMGYWDSDIVMNEILPNPTGNDCSLSGINGEWVEIYNKNTSQKELTGWYIKDTANHIIPIQISNTMDSSTTIGANGSGSEWLVLFMNGCILNDGGDTVTLYNNNGVQVDTYTYTTPDHNINSTPDGTNNLVAYLPFDGDLQDQSGNANNGTSQGTTGFSSGKINDGLSLNGSAGYVEVPDSPSLDIIDKITLEAWVYPTAWDNSHENNILTKGGNGDYGVYNLHYKTTSSGFRFEINNGSTQTLFETSASTDLNKWYHVVGTYDGSIMKLYINGILSNFKNTAGQIQTNNTPLRIGKQFWWGDIYSYWNGLIDEVKIYNRALSADEILAHYNATTPTGVVPENKSYARIPDGANDWVDPIPSPGRPNVLTEEEMIELGMFDMKYKAHNTEQDIHMSNIVKEQEDQEQETSNDELGTTSQNQNKEQNDKKATQNDNNPEITQDTTKIDSEVMENDEDMQNETITVEGNSYLPAETTTTPQIDSLLNEAENATSSTSTDSIIIVSTSSVDIIKNTDETGTTSIAGVSNTEQEVMIDNNMENKTNNAEQKTEKKGEEENSELSITDSKSISDEDTENKNTEQEIDNTKQTKPNLTNNFEENVEASPKQESVIEEIKITKLEEIPTVSLDKKVEEIPTVKNENNES